MRAVLPDGLEISARTGLGLERLAEAVDAAASEQTIDCAIRVAIGNGRTQAWVRERFLVDHEEADIDAVHFRCRGHAEDLARVRAMGGEVLDSPPE